MRARTATNGFAAAVPVRDAQGLTADEFLTSQFEFEYCCECGGDAPDHVVVIGPFGNWFAYCAKTSEANGAA